MKSYINEDNYVSINGRLCHLYFSEYMNGTIYMEANDAMFGELFTVCTINWEKNFQGNQYAKALGFPLVVLNKFSGNAGIDFDLERAGVIEKGGAYLEGSQGNVEARTLNSVYQKICQHHLACQEERLKEAKYCEALKQKEMEPEEYILLKLLRPGDKVKHNGSAFTVCTFAKGHPGRLYFAQMDFPHTVQSITAKNLAKQVEAGNFIIAGSPSYIKGRGIELSQYLLRELLRPGDILAMGKDIYSVNSVRKLGSGKVYIQSERTHQQYNPYTETLLTSIYNGELAFLNKKSLEQELRETPQLKL